jgi:hypothetical protein
MVVEVIEHLNDWYLESSLELIKQLLAKQGVVIFTTPNDEDLAKSMILCPSTNEVFHRWQHVRSWNNNSIRASLNEHGYKVIDILETRFLIPGKQNRSGSFSIRKKITSILKRIFLKKAVARRPFKMPHLVAVAGLNS